MKLQFWVLVMKCLDFSLIVFVFLSVICANVANVYSASVGWEVLAPSALVGRKEYLILGLGLTVIFIFVSNLFSVELLLNSSRLFSRKFMYYSSFGIYNQPDEKTNPQSFRSKNLLYRLAPIDIHKYSSSL